MYRNRHGHLFGRFGPGRGVDLAPSHGFESLAEFRGKMNYGNAESDVYQRVQYMKYFPHDAE